MVDNLRTAIDCCEKLATAPRKGRLYDRFRDALKLVEGCCDQASVWRQDTRWLPLGMMMAEAHKRAGEWLRGTKMPNGTRRPIPHGEQHPLFVMLAENLCGLLKVAEEFRTKATGRVGMILPEVGAPFMDGMVRRESGLLIPARLN